MTTVMQSYFELKSELKCPIHRAKDLDRLVLDQTESNTLICSLCEYTMKKEKRDKMSLTVPLEAFLQQLQDLEVIFTNKVSEILLKNQAKRDELLLGCDRLINSFLQFQSEMKKQIHEQEENIKANVHKANESTKVIVDRILGKYTTKSTFEGLYQNIVSKLKFDKETGDLQSLIEYDVALKQAQMHSTNFIIFAKQISEDIDGLFNKFNKYNTLPANTILEISREQSMQNSHFSKVSSLNTSLLLDKELNMNEAMQYLQNSNNSSKINLKIDGKNCNQSQFMQKLNQQINSNSKLQECAIYIHGGQLDLNDAVKLVKSGVQSIKDFSFRCNEISISKEEINSKLSDYSNKNSSNHFEKYEAGLKLYQQSQKNINQPFIDRTNAEGIEVTFLSEQNFKKCTKQTIQQLSGVVKKNEVKNNYD